MGRHIRNRLVGVDIPADTGGEVDQRWLRLNGFWDGGGSGAELFDGAEI